MNLKVIGAMVCLCLPVITLAQASGGGGFAGTLNSLHSVLDTLYDELMPKCKELSAVSMGLAGFAALWYIAYRVWGHLARVEPIDFYPLFRPFVLGFCILNFPLVLGMINAVMKPTVTGTAAMVDNANKSIETLLILKDSAMKKSVYHEMFYGGPEGKGDRAKWYKYTHPDEDPADENFFERIGNNIRMMSAKISYEIRYSIKLVISEILQLLFAAVALCINTLRTFNLVILSILGPLVFGISVFDGFQHTMKLWLARYINVFLWLPVANIFGSVIGTIQVRMLKLDLAQIQQTGDTFLSTTDMGYLVFLIIGIYGYTTVPSIANQIVRAGGGDVLTSKFSRDAGAAANAVSAGTVNTANHMVGRLMGN